jgi:hypothetical protein
MQHNSTLCCFRHQELRVKYELEAVKFTAQQVQHMYSLAIEGREGRVREAIIALRAKDENGGLEGKLLVVLVVYAACSFTAGLFAHG